MTQQPRLWRSIALGVAFVILVVVSIFTVVVPEMEDDTNEEGPQETGQDTNSENSLNTP